MAEVAGRGMAGLPTRTGWWGVRALIAVVALVGLFAMHGLTVGHDPSMGAMTAASSSATHGDQSALLAMTDRPMAAAALAEVSGPVASPLMGSLVMGSNASNVTIGSPVQHMNGLMTACVAILLGLLLLLLAVPRVLSWWRVTYPVVLGRTRIVLSAGAGRPPDLAELCVLRT